MLFAAATPVIVTPFDASTALITLSEAIAR